MWDNEMWDEKKGFTQTGSPVFLLDFLLHCSHLYEHVVSYFVIQESVSIHPHTSDVGESVYKVLDEFSHWIGDHEVLTFQEPEKSEGSHSDLRRCEEVFISESVKNSNCLWRFGNGKRDDCGGLQYFGCKPGKAFEIC